MYTYALTRKPKLRSLRRDAYGVAGRAAVQRRNFAALWFRCANCSWFRLTCFFG